MRTLGRRSLVLVTGGAGLLGATLVRRLLSEGYRVRVLDDLSRGRRERLAGLDVELIVDDVRSERVVREAVAGAGAVVHLAAWRPHDGNAREERIGHDVNVTGTLLLCGAAHAARVSRFVFASTAAVYTRTAYLLHEETATRPTSVEGAQKLAAETYVHLHVARDGLPGCVLRLFSLYGPGQDVNAADAGLVPRFVGLAAAGKALTIHGDGSQTRDLLHVDDAAQGIVLALTAPGVVGRAINVAAGQSVAVKHVAAVLSELVGGLPPLRYEPARPGELHDVRASLGAASAMLGFRPRVALRDGLRSCLNALAAPVAAGPAATPTPTRAVGSGALRPPPIPRNVPPPAVRSNGLFADRPPSWAMREGAEESVPIPIVEDVKGLGT